MMPICRTFKGTHGNPLINFKQSEYTIHEESKDNKNNTVQLAFLCGVPLLMQNLLTFGDDSFYIPPGKEVLKTSVSFIT